MLLSEVSQADWLSKRISWFLELMKAMEVPVETLEKEMRRISVKESRIQLINSDETVKGFVDILQNASLS